MLRSTIDDGLGINRWGWPCELVARWSFVEAVVGCPLIAVLLHVDGFGSGEWALTSQGISPRLHCPSRQTRAVLMKCCCPNRVSRFYFRSRSRLLRSDTLSIGWTPQSGLSYFNFVFKFGISIVLVNSVALLPAHSKLTSQ
jgi:hypothetical protein